MKTYINLKMAGSLAALVAVTLSCTLDTPPTPTAVPTETPPTAIPTEAANGLSGVEALIHYEHSTGYPWTFVN